MLIIKSISTIIMLLIITSIITNFATAQQSKNIGIKITSPIKGQLIPLTNNDLKISGIAAHNGSLTCNVYIIVNDIKPYQKALPTGGHNDIKDYSTWIYNLVPSYTTIKTGTNKITSKLACQMNNTKTGDISLTQYYGINVTGTANSLKNSSNSNISNINFNNNKKHTSIEKMNVPISNDRIKRLGSAYTNSQPVTLLSTAGILSLSTPRVDKHSDLTTKLTTKTGDINLNNNGSTEYIKEQSNTSAIDKTQKTSFGSNYSNNNTKSLSVSMHLTKGPIHVGSRENLTVAVTDSNSTHAIPGAAILGKIVNLSGVSKKLEGTTDGKGKVLYSWLISGEDNTSGKYKVLMEASAPGYENKSVSKTFTVLPIRTIIYNNDNSMTTASPDLRINPSIANSRPILSLSPKTYNNLNSPLIFSNQSPPPLPSRVYIPSGNSLSYENSRVYIPSYTHNNNNNMITTYNKVSIPNPNTNITVEQGVNPIQKPVEQGVNPIQKPQLPNNQEPFVMATPLLHINNGTYGTSLPASHQLSSTATAIAVDLVDRMRVMGFDSGLIGSP
ncbi:MAG: hypothetical protein WBZ36_13135 [Candidatus Nitrosopolaris sp.]